MEQLLTAVRTVCAGHPIVCALTHVAHTIDAFLWAGISHWTLERASKRGSVSLLDRLLKREWPDFTRQCRELRLWRGLKDAITCGYDVPVMAWWLRTYLPDQEVIPMDAVYKLAINHARLPVLERVYQETKGILPLLTYPLYRCSPDTAAWLLDHGDCPSCYSFSPVTSSFQSIKRCLLHQDEDSSFTFHDAEKAVREALAYCEHEDLQWLYERRPEFFHLDVVRWLHHHRSEGCTTDAMDKAAAEGHLEIVQWLHENRSEGCTTRAMDHAAKNGHVRVVR